MQISGTFRSKVARRVVLLFFSCALLPVAVLSTVSFREVSSQLKIQVQQELKRTSKNQGMTILERLLMVNSDLQNFFSGANGHEQVSDPGANAKNHLVGLTVFSGDGGEVYRWKNAPLHPALTSREIDHLLSGRALLKLGYCGTPSSQCLLLMRMEHARRTLLVAALNPQYVFASANVDPQLQYGVVSGSGNILFTSSTGREKANFVIPFTQASGVYQWTADSSSYDAAYWKLLLRPEFFENDWTIVISQPHADVIAPVLRFRKMFLLVILLSLLSVLFLSMVQIRRTLVPLMKLRKSTDEIRAGQFDARVEITSSDEFGELALSFNSMALQLGRQFHTLKTIHGIDQAIFASLDGDAIVESVLARMPSLLPCDCFGVCAFDEGRTSGWARYYDVSSGQMRSETIGMSSADWLQLQTNPIAFSIAGKATVPGYLPNFYAIGMRSFLVIPIRVDNSVHAALVCAQRDSGLLLLEDMQEARTVADQLAVAFSHVRLIHSLEELHWGALTALARAIDAKSKWTAGHSERVTNLAIEIGKKMKLSPKDLRNMQMGGLLHDIGKIGTPPEVLDKPDKLTPNEMDVMRDHVRTGVRILEPIPGFREALTIVSQHHEWFNGKGYPEGLSGREISLYARIFAVADCYDAITSDRPYRKGLPKEKTLEILQKGSGIQFDPEIIQVFMAMLAEDAKPKSLSASAGAVQ